MKILENSLMFRKSSSLENFTIDVINALMWIDFIMKIKVENISYPAAWKGQQMLDNRVKQIAIL